MEKIYYGVNHGPGPQQITVHYANTGQKYPLKHVYRHSPDGFQWGYGGSGPADAALSILADCFNLALANQHYQAFKKEFIAAAGKILCIHELEIKNWIKERPGQKEEKDG